MVRIGMENVPESVNKYYQTEEKGFLVMTVGGTYGSKCDGYWNKSIAILGYIEVGTGRTSSIKSSLSWSVEDYKADKNFKKSDIIYRIKGRLPKLLDGDEPWINNEYRMSGLYVTEIISENEKNDFLENLLTEYQKEVSINSEVLGKLILNKDTEVYGTEPDVDWCGNIISISISGDGDDIDELLADAEEFYKNRQEWNRKIREYASKELTELANDWRDDEDDTEITEKDFAERIAICDISFYGDGDFSVYCDDDDMFWGHTVVVYGNIKTGFDSAEIAG